MSHQQQPPQPPNSNDKYTAAPQQSGSAGESSNMIQQHHAQSAAAAAMAAAAAAAAAAQGTAPGAHPVFDLAKFWQEQLHVAESFESDFKNHPLPLARIKKVMKTDQDVKMISAEAPILFAKGCEIFITELTKRAWVHAEENKRRTLQRSDIATAISKTDMCDFLIDIVPREEAAKSSSAVYDQNAYQYYQSANVPQYTSAQQIDPAAYYPQLSQLTPEQMQQYQLQLQQFAAQQHPYAQQMQSRQNAPGQSAPGSSAQPGQPSNSDATKSESQQQ